MLFVLDADTELNNRVLAAQTDEAAFEALVRRQKRFILGCAYKTVRRFVSESDDEWSVALIAFHEAVRSYDGSRGSFKPYAALVIKRRLLDHLERESRRRREIAADIVGGELASGEPSD